MTNDGSGKVILVVIEDLTRRTMMELETPHMNILIQAGTLGFVEQPAAFSSGSIPLYSILTSRDAGPELDSFDKGHLDGVEGNIINLVHRKGRSTAGYFYRSRFHNLFHLYGPFDYPASEMPVQHARGNQDRTNTVAKAAREIVAVKPDFCLIYISCMENIGRRTPAGSSLSLKHIRMSDNALGVLLGVISLFGLFGEYHILLTGETGGRCMEAPVESHKEIEIPWLAFGPRIARGMSLARTLSPADTAPTVAELMDLPLPASWQGEAVREAILEPAGRNCDVKSVA